MTDLFSRIESILTEKNQQATDTYSFTLFSVEQVASALLSELPKPLTTREEEARYALKLKRYGRCKIYPQLVDDSAFIEAVNRIVDVLEALQTNATTLPQNFRSCVQSIVEAQRRVALANDSEDEGYANQVANDATGRLEKLAIDIFARGLGDVDEQSQASLARAV